LFLRDLGIYKEIQYDRPKMGAKMSANSRGYGARRPREAAAGSSLFLLLSMLRCGVRDVGEAALPRVRTDEDGYGWRQHPGLPPAP
jgi:hypothetical protein